MKDETGKDQSGTSFNPQSSKRKRRRSKAIEAEKKPGHAVAEAAVTDAAALL